MKRAAITVGLALALFLGVSAQAQSTSTWAGQVPFVGVDPNELVQSRVTSEQERLAWATQVAQSPGRYDPDYFEGAAQALEVGGREEVARSLYVLSLLRQSTMSRACGAETWSSVDFLRGRLLALMAPTLGTGGGEALRNGVERALALDEATPFAFRPRLEWCDAAFSRTPLMHVSAGQLIQAARSGPDGDEDLLWQSARLRDPNAFVSIHRQQRARLQQAAASTLDAAQRGLQRGLTPFALGIPDDPSPSATQDFLKYYEPEAIPAASPAIGRPMGLSHDGSTVVFHSNDFVDGQSFWTFTFATTLYGSRSPPIQMPVGFGEDARVTARGHIISARRFVCSLALPQPPVPPQRMDCPVQERVQISIVSPDGTLSSIDTTAPILTRDRQWIVSVTQVSANGRWALLHASGINTLRPGLEDTVSAYLIVDLNTGVLAQSALVERGVSEAIFYGWTSRVTEDDTGAPVVVVGSGGEARDRAARLLTLDPWSERDLSTNAAIGRHTYSIVGSRGYVLEGNVGLDARASFQRCESDSSPARCRPLAWTPDRQNVLYQRGTELVLVRGDGREELGVFQLTGTPMVQSSADGSLLIVSQAGSVQAYRYRPH